MKIDIEKIKTEHLKFAQQRGLGATYCPSEVARRIFPENWRNYMDTVRKVADDLVNKEVLVTLQKGEIIENIPSQAKGPIRLKLKG